jgi:hypothetical protein
LWGGKWFHPTGNQSFRKTLSLARKQYISLQRKTEQKPKNRKNNEEQQQQRNDRVEQLKEGKQEDEAES